MAREKCSVVAFIEARKAVLKGGNTIEAMIEATGLTEGSVRQKMTKLRKDYPDLKIPGFPRKSSALTLDVAAMNAMFEDAPSEEGEAEAEAEVELEAAE